ncbi:Serine/threonine protein kinase [Mycena kentingensis (nom. inval.)]|nr:Serine/threonine protein kinase [Mycena kentingensis (nom. inval.)]
MYVPQDHTRPRARTPNAEPTYPEPGTRIDNGTLELVEILGVGGYGVVYRAVSTDLPTPRTFAVKCLQHSHSARQRQLHIREIALHQLCGAHPAVVTLHRVVEEASHTFIVLDFAPDGDLFSQILYGCRYLGNTRLIKHVFAQLLDAVEYCHSMQIFHRDLKPENVLCFDDGYRVALTDFGLATTEKLSEEFRTGSVYHMSPECQGGDFSPTGAYSPMFNDIWSLGIVLLNLATGRNPWKAAIPADSTFRAYLHDPAHFLPSVLPISSALNAVLVRMLALDWRDRPTIPEIRVALARVKTFYSEGAVFEGSMARCPWEVGVDLEAATASDAAADEDAAEDPRNTEASPQRPAPSDWSDSTNSSLGITFAVPRTGTGTTSNSSSSTSSTQYSSCGATWAFDSPISSDEEEMFALDDKYVFEHPRTPPPITVPISPLPPPQRPAFIVTPSIPRGGKPSLAINTNRLDPAYYTAKNVSVNIDLDLDSASTRSSASVMRTAVDDEPGSAFFLASSKASVFGSDADGYVDKEMTSALWDEDDEAGNDTGLAMEDGEGDATSNYCSTRSSIAGSDSGRSGTPSPDTEAGMWHAQTGKCQFSTSIFGSITDSSSPCSSSPRSPNSAFTFEFDSPQTAYTFVGQDSAAVHARDADVAAKSLDPFQSFLFEPPTPTSPSFETWSFSATPPASPRARPGAAGVGRGQTRTTRHLRPWFLRAKLFGSAESCR